MNRTSSRISHPKITFPSLAESFFLCTLNSTIRWTCGREAGFFFSGYIWRCARVVKTSPTRSRTWQRKKKQCVRTTEIVWFVYAVHVWRVQNHTVIYVYIKPVCWQTGSSKRWHLSEGRPVIRTSRLLWHATSGSRMQLAARTRCSREASPDNVFDKHVSIHPTMWRVCHVLPVCACAQRDSLVNLRTGR